MFETAPDVAAAVGARHPLPVDGEALHESVPPEFWCVTHDDLRRFRKIVKAAVCRGHIFPTELDPFNPDDDRVGPCIHTVNSQFIKPITSLAGNCSWALMCNPNGGKCDVYVTHSWQEGILEFVDKVLHSWPRGARYAYCCMLSNPQNLDIAEMISSPLQSPFAQALRSATHMLVVPNSKQSIYTRIWCAYEAFLAHKWGKMIFTASSPLQRLWCHVLFVPAMFFLGLVLAKLTRLVSGQLDVDLAVVRVLLLVILACVVLSAFSRVSMFARAVNYLGGFTAGIYLDFCIEMKRSIYVATDHSLAIHSRVVDFMALAFFAIAEADQMWGARAHIEADQLIRGYTGQLCKAQSSNEKDKRAILAEIASSGCSDAVNEAVDVLIKAGMSSPSLQQAASLGVDIKSTGRCKASVAFISWAVWFASPLVDILADPSWSCYITLAEATICISGFLWLPMDRRTFTSLAVMKVFHLWNVVPIVAMFVFDQWNKLFYSAFEVMVRRQIIHEWFQVSMAFGALVPGPITMLFSAMGPGRIAHVPVIGPYLSQYILGINCYPSPGMWLFWWCRCCRRTREAPRVDVEGAELGVRTNEGHIGERWLVKGS